MRRLPPIVLLVLLVSSNVAAKDWRGIRPMHSTREDVIAVLGPAPSKGAEGQSVYSLDEGGAQIVFADDDSLKKKNCAVAAGTVLLIRITPKESLLTSLNLDQEKFRKFYGSYPAEAGYEGFIDDKEGLVIRAFEGKVEEMVYFAATEGRVRCPAYFEKPENLVRRVLCWLPLKFDEYGDISFSDEKARLDNFAIQVMNSAEMGGYIIAYAGRKARVAEAQMRANRARDYLIKVRKLDPKRIKTIDGGHQEELTVSLYVWPTVGDPPPIYSTVKPSDVEIINEKKKQPRRKRS
jgi:hypothetical protein